MSPDYEIQEGKVQPIWTLSRGPPNPKINERYIFEKYSKLFDVKK